MRKLTAGEMIMRYTDHCIDRHPKQYEEYKEWLNEFERVKEEFFWTDIRIPHVDTMIDYDRDYKFELDRIKELGYVGYCNDRLRRHTNAFIIDEGYGRFLKTFK